MDFTAQFLKAMRESIFCRLFVAYLMAFSIGRVAGLVLFWLVVAPWLRFADADKVTADDIAYATDTCQCVGIVACFLIVLFAGTISLPESIRGIAYGILGAVALTVTVIFVVGAKAERWGFQDGFERTARIGLMILPVAVLVGGVTGFVYSRQPRLSANELCSSTDKNNEEGHRPSPH